ncbi:hypothetical protein JQC67_03680 [Aurantibacter crassamenti]|uniref:hypothetical protein n=1 Tax=Aurantibacter crassamenti TaxID=1837375 RepID=UPI001939C9E9|nr:hypothetical protein [Aurantibacter crassamenti]MBM1105233.1 hypothetical protein [Aurantibacter crassamenti]
MYRILIFTLCLFVFQSCIPLRIAPDIDTYKVSKGKKFKRSLPKRQMYIFEDSKQAGEFYAYINSKYQLNDIDVYDDIPINISGQEYFFAFYEVDIPDKSVNFMPVLFEQVVNAALNLEDENQAEPVEIRRDNYYIAIEVYSDIEKDCLSSNALSRESVLNYLSNLRQEYLITNNYNELVFKN